VKKSGAYLPVGNMRYTMTSPGSVQYGVKVRKMFVSPLAHDWPVY